MEHTALLKSLETLEVEAQKEDVPQLATMMKVFVRDEVPKFKAYIRRTGEHHYGKTFD